MLEIIRITGFFLKKRKKRNANPKPKGEQKGELDLCSRCAGKPELRLGTQSLWHCEPSDLSQISRRNLTELKETKKVKRESMV